MVLVHGQCPECQRMDVVHYGKRIEWDAGSAHHPFRAAHAGGAISRIGLQVVWPQCLALALIGTVLFGIALARFRKTIGTMA